MSIVFNLHRFGNDEFAVGHLINGDFPADDEERWQILDAPRYRIEKLFYKNLRAQNALQKCAETRLPFVLFLLSFTAEHKGNRLDREVISNATLHSMALQKRLCSLLPDANIPLMKLHWGQTVLIQIQGMTLMYCLHTGIAGRM